jgi:GNAT superfamily N-acetyltransferase
MSAVDGGASALRDAAVRRLVELSEAGALSQAQVEPAAQGLGVSARTVWRLVARARSRADQAVRPRFALDKQLRERLAFSVERPTPRCPAIAVTDSPRASRARAMSSWLAVTATGRPPRRPCAAAAALQILNG